MTKVTLNNFGEESNKYIMDPICYTLQSLRTQINHDSCRSYEDYFDYSVLE